MSELKAEYAYTIDEIEVLCSCAEGNEFYLKSDADDVIVKLKQKINEAQTELELWRDGSIISEAHQKELDEKRHSDYKRCLAMAKICENKLGTIVKPGWYDKWRRHWLELAEKFKEYENGRR